MRDPAEVRPVEMTRKEAEELFNVIIKLRNSRVEIMKSINRKRCLPSAKAMACVPYQVQLTALEKLQEQVGTAFHIGGY